MDFEEDVAPPAPEQGEVLTDGEPPSLRVTSFSAEFPVALAVAPDGRLFYTELSTGRVRVVSRDGALQPEPFIELAVSTHGESGLLGLTLDPRFVEDHYVYVLRSVPGPGSAVQDFPLGQDVVRYTDVNSRGQDPVVIIPNLPATTSLYHNGGRIAFGPDGDLYVSIGDTDREETAQDLSSWAGKVLRFAPDGSIPSDNPIPGSPVFASGLRNVFGMAFNPQTGALYASDNGPDHGDEVNVIKAGANYGWPRFSGGAGVLGYEDPIYEWTPTIAPTGVAFLPDHPDVLLLCDFNHNHLHALFLDGERLDHVAKDVIVHDGCALDVAVAPDGAVYIATIQAISRIDGLGAYLDAIRRQ